jgi:glycine hydroxymethyltransferase
MPDLQSDHHDERLLAISRSLISSEDGRKIFDHLHELVGRHEDLRVREGVNLIAAEAPSSAAVRHLLSGDLGARASGGAIGGANRYFAGLQFADEIEALCIASLCKLFNCRRADPRLMSGLHATTVVYAALKTRRGARSLMSLAACEGGDTSNRINGPAGVLGYQIDDIPTSGDKLSIDLDRFEQIAKKTRPDVVSLGAGLNLFPFPVREIKAIIEPWDGVLYFDGAHQAGLIAGGVYPNPLDQGADILSASSGKTFSGPQGGFLCWNDEDLTDPIYSTIFPTLTGTHQLNRVAALTAACCEISTFGSEYMSSVVRNAQRLGRALHNEGLEVVGADRGYTRTHQLAIRLPGNIKGADGVSKLALCGINANKVALPGDLDDSFSGVRFGLVEVTRLGMGEAEMVELSGIIAAALLQRQDPSRLAARAIEVRREFQKLQYCFPGR